MDGPALTAREVKLLMVLVEADGAAVHRQQLLQEVWQRRDDTRAVDHAVRRLRNKLGDPEGIVLKSVRGVGLRLGFRVAGSESHLVGREADIQHLREVVIQHPWVTVVGVGGVGKTSLAQAAFPAAVFCDLAACSSKDEVLDTIAQQIGAQASPDSLGLALRSAGRLLVLDNCEQIERGALSSIQQLVQSGGVNVLATSRERLGGPERVVELGPLPPKEAGQLLAKVAALAGRPIAQKTSDIEALAQKVDGIPLAIELLATTLRFRTFQEVDGELSAMMLADPKRPNQRHRSLRAAFEWSWCLLNLEQQQVLAGCSEFVNTWDLVAAEQVLDDPGGQLLGQLVDAGWVRWRPAEGVSRFSLYQTIQAFAAEQLTGQTAAIAHGTYFVQVAEGLRSDPVYWREPGQRAAPDVGNFAKAAATQQQATPAIAAGLGYRFLEQYSSILPTLLPFVDETTGVDGLLVQLHLVWAGASVGSSDVLVLAQERVRAMLPLAPPALRCAALITLAHSYKNMHEVDEYRALAGDIAPVDPLGSLHLAVLRKGLTAPDQQEARIQCSVEELRCAERLGQAGLISDALTGLAFETYTAGHLTQALGMADRAVVLLSNEDQQGWKHARSLRMRGLLLAAGGQLNKAIDDLEHAVSMMGLCGMHRWQGPMFLALADLYLRDNQLSRAEALAQQGLGSAPSSYQSIGKTILASVKRRQGFTIEARALLTEAIMIASELNVGHFKAQAEIEQCTLALELGQLEGASEAIGAALDYLQGIGRFRDYHCMAIAKAGVVALRQGDRRGAERRLEELEAKVQAEHLKGYWHADRGVEELRRALAQQE